LIAAADYAAAAINSGSARFAAFDQQWPRDVLSLQRSATGKAVRLRGYLRQRLNLGRAAGRRGVERETQEDGGQHGVLRSANDRAGPMNVC
jgi:hypothetical protein